MEVLWLLFHVCLLLWSSMVEVDKMIRYLKFTVFFCDTLCPEKKTTPGSISWGIQGCISAESQQQV